MSFTRQSRFMRSMTPSGSVKMSTSRFNMVCGKTVEQAVRPNLDRIPNPQAPKVLDSRVLTPSVTRRGLERERERERGRSQTRDSYGLQTCGRPPVAPPRDSSLHVPFGSYAEKGIHSRPGRSASEYEILDNIGDILQICEHHIGPCDTHGVQEKCHARAGGRGSALLITGALNLDSRVL